MLDANLELVRQGLVLFTFGNASGIDRDRGLVVIKPSGVDYSALAPSDMVVTDMDGKVVDGRLRPSSDLATHILLYKEFPGIGGRGAHAFGIRDSVGPGRARDSRLRNHPRGLLLWPGSRHRGADRRGNRRRLRSQHRASRSAAVSGVSTRLRFRLFW